jgi:hypothetical protein
MADDDDIAGMVRDIHAAFFKPPMGSTDQPLIEEIREVVTVYKRLSWAGKALLYIAAILGAVVALWGHIKAGLLRMFGVNG